MTHREPLSTAAIIRRVWLGQLFFSAGHALTTGGFLNYFADPYFKGFAFAFAVLQITPEAAESLSVVTRWIVQRVGNPKQVWWISLLLGRLVALAIPGLVLCGAAPGSHLAMAFMIGCLGVWYLLLGISYTALLSWLSQEVPEIRWGRMLASRSIAISLVTIAMTWTASRLVDWAMRGTGWDKTLVYPVLFAIGGGICVLSILPLLSVSSRVANSDDPPASGEPERAATSNWQMLSKAWANIGFRRFLIGSWQLAFFQGLTQTAQYHVSRKVLGVSLSQYYTFVSVMLLLQIPLAALSGWLVDRGRDRQVIVYSLVALSLAMGFWLLAVWFGAGWLWGAYLIWGLFGLVNVAQPSLALKLSPRGDNAIQLSLFRPMGSLMAAISGLIGGTILSRFAEGAELAPLGVYLWLFVISGVGRALSALWYLPATTREIAGIEGANSA